MTTENGPAPISSVLPEETANRLMKLLDSVRLDRTEPELQKPHSVEEGCLQCGSLTPWGINAWCPDCGYYPKLGRTISPSEIDGDQQKVERKPLDWVVWLALGGLCLASASVASIFLLPDPVERAIIGRLQFVVGLILIIVSQIWAYLTSCQGTDSLHISAIFFEPVQVWSAVAKDASRYRRTIYAGCGGWLCLFLASFVIGLDLDGMFSNQQPRITGKNTIQAILKTVMSVSESAPASSAASNLMDDLVATGPQSTGSADAEMNDLKAFAGEMASNLSMDQAPLPTSAPGELNEPSLTGSNGNGSEQGPLILENKEAPLSPSGQIRADRAEFVILGYLFNPAGKIRSLLLADISSSRIRFVGRVSLDELSEEERHQIQTQLDEIRTSSPILRTPFHARWVLPVFLADVAHVGWTPHGQLKEGYLMNLNDRRSSAVASDGEGNSPAQ